MASTSSMPALHLRQRGLAALAMGYLRLMRPANLVTAAADILAAAVITAAPARIFVWLVASSVCLYAGGVVLNDFFDRDLDAVERPERPIPASVVPAYAAACLGFGLLLAGVAFAYESGPVSAAVAGLVAVAVLTYNAWAKRNPTGPFVMGLCRGLNLLLGLSAATGVMVHRWPLAFLPLIYIVAITTFSRGEVHGGSRRTSGITLSLVACVLLAILALPVALKLPHCAALWPFAVLLAIRVGPPLWRAWQDPVAPRIRAGVHAGVVSLVVLDACLAAAFGGVVEGAAVLSLSVLSAELAKCFAVT